MGISLGGGRRASLSISSTDLRLLVAEGRRIKRWGSAPLQPGLVRDGQIMDRAAVAGEMSALFDALKAPKRGVIVGMAGLPFSYRVINLPKMKDDLLEEAIVRTAKKEIPVPLEQLYVSWRQVPSRNGGQDFFVLGVTREAVDTLTATMAEAGIRGEVLDLKELALARVANQAEAFVVALEPDSYDVVLISEGVPAVMQSVTPRQREATVRDNISRLTDQLSRTVQFHNSTHPTHVLDRTTPVLMTGALSADEGVADLVRSGIGFPVETLAPPLTVPSEMPVGEYATNIGLVLKGMLPARATSGGGSFYDLNLDLLAPLRRRIPVRKVLGYTAVGALIALAAAMLVPSFDAVKSMGVETEALESDLMQSMRDLRQVRTSSGEVQAMEASVDDILAAADALSMEHRNLLNSGIGVGNTLSARSQQHAAAAGEAGVGHAGR